MSAYPPLPFPEGVHLTVALPSGRLRDTSIGLLRQAGLMVDVPAESRSLRHEFGPISLLEVKDPDVPVYVDIGVADVGVVGKDHILESGLDSLEPLDLRFGPTRCSLIRLIQASGRIERVGTKYPRIARGYLQAKGWPADVIKLNGKIELAAVTGLVDAVIDLVETGGTLKANGLEEVEVIRQLSARLIVNRAALKLKSRVLRPLIQRLGALVAEAEVSATAQTPVTQTPTEPS
jgi:ATP phosphoribosyltransferase